MSNAIHSAESAEGTAETGARKNKGSRNTVVLKLAVAVLVLFLAISSAIAVFEHNNAVSLQGVVNEQDNTLAKSNNVISWLDTALNLTQLTLTTRPPDASRYLTTLPNSDSSGGQTKIYLVATASGYSYDPYTWPFNAELRSELYVPTNNGSIVKLPDFGWSYLPENYQLTVGNEPRLMIGVTVRNDYTVEDVGKGAIGNVTGSYQSSVNLTVRFYGQDENIVQIPYVNNLPTYTANSGTAVGGVTFVLGSGQTKQVTFYFSVSDLNTDAIKRYEIYVSSLSAY